MQWESTFWMVEWVSIVGQADKCRHTCLFYSQLEIDIITGTKSQGTQELNTWHFWEQLMKEIFWKHLTINHFSLLENEVLAWHCQERTGHLFSLSLLPSLPPPSWVNTSPCGRLMDGVSHVFHSFSTLYSSLVQGSWHRVLQLVV